MDRGDEFLWFRHQSFCDDRYQSLDDEEFFLERNRQKFVEVELTDNQYGYVCCLKTKFMLLTWPQKYTKRIQWQSTSIKKRSNNMDLMLLNK